jgi:DNA-binding NarL/FixJ family response regulator
MTTANPQSALRSPESSISVAIVEDDDKLRLSVAALLDGTPGFRCAGAHRDFHSALDRVPREKPDIALVDIGLPDGSGIELVRQLCARLPALRVLMLTIEQDSRKIFEALKAGASGYLIKHVPYAELLEAIEELHAGGAPMSPQVAWLLIKFFREHSETLAHTEPLTPREEQVLALLAQGYCYKEVAGRLECSLKTISSHCEHIYAKLHVHSRAEAAARYFQRQPPPN